MGGGGNVAYCKILMTHHAIGKPWNFLLKVVSPF